MNHYRGGSGGAVRERPLRRLAITSATAILLAGTAMPIQAGAAASGAATGAAAEQAPEQQLPEIIVTAPSLFRDVRPERTLDETGISSYGVSTIEDLIGEIQVELGEGEEPVFVVNGERVYDLDDIGAYPVEVVRQLQVLPRGSAARVGGSPNQRVISLALHRQMRSGTVTVAPRLATEGDWRSTRGETIFTHVSGRRRGNVSLRVRDENALLESQRGIIQPTAQIPYATGGNVIAYPDLSGEIDPLLSDAAGETVTVVPFPATPHPTLADFAADANQENITDLGLFRTLRPALRSYDLNATYTAPLTSWLMSTATLRLGRSTSRSQLGLPSGIFVLSSENPASPFSVPVGLAFFGEDPLRSRYRRESGEANLTLTARLSDRWRLIFNGKHSRSDENTRTERPEASNPIPLENSLDPFATDLSEMVQLRIARAGSLYHTTMSQLSVNGSPFRLPAGDPTVTVEGRLAWHSLRSNSSFSDEVEKVSRSERSARAVVEVPLTSRRRGVLPAIGELSASAEYGLRHYSDVGTANRSIVGLTWEPREFLRLRGSLEDSREPASIELLGAPIIVTPSVRVFDFLTGETVDVTYVSGGNPDLRPQSTNTKRLSTILRLVPSLGLQLSGEYADIRIRDFVASLPPASEAVMLAFPDRFVRDTNGVLSLVDVRPVNFADHRQRRLRYGLSLNAPLGGGGRPGFSIPAAEGEEPSEEPPRAEGAPTSAWPPARLQLTANHNIILLDKILIRPGLDPVDLLDGGAIGIAGGRVRHEIDATAALTSGGTGVRLGTSWRGPSLLEARIVGEQSLLRFSPVLLVNLRAFADARRLFPGSGWSPGTRFSINVVNLTNRRQRVRDPFGNTPLQYQPAYRDPIGRTVEFEIRKTF